MLRQAIQEAMQSGNESAVEYRIQRRDGVTRWIASRGRRQPASAGSPDRLMGVSTDITDSKCIELELAKLRERLQAESDYLKEEIFERGRFEEIVGQTRELKSVFQRIEHVAETDSVVLITGETGTGKELVARAIHNLSRRKDRVMVKVDCASLPPSLIESELFGREKGAYSMVTKLSLQLQALQAASGGNVEVGLMREVLTEVRSSVVHRRSPPQLWNQPRFFFPEIKTQTDLANMLVGTTWRKKNDVEHVILHDERTFYSNHAGHPLWRKNNYSLGQSLGSMMLVWSVDGLQAPCQFNEQFNEFVEMANPAECVWSIIATKPHTPSWGI